MAGEAVVPETKPDEVMIEDDASVQNDVHVNDKGEEVSAKQVPDDEDANLTASQLSEESGKSEAEREVIRERRREEKRRKRDNFNNMKHELKARDTAINQLQEQLNILQRKSSGGEMAQIDQAIKQTGDAYAFYKNQIKEATEQANGTGVAEATEKMLQATQKFQQLNQIKQGYQRQAAAPAPLDPRLLNHAQGWMEDNDWYDPAAKDDDSEIMRTIDNRLAQEGWDPKTLDYWEELSRRGQKYLPHRFAKGQDRGIVTPNGSSRPRQTVAGSGRDATPGQGGTFTLSAARVSAIKEAGAWDDPKRRAAMISRFKEYDRNNRA